MEATHRPNRMVFPVRHTRRLGFVRNTRRVQSARSFVFIRVWTWIRRVKKINCCNSDKSETINRGVGSTKRHLVTFECGQYVYPVVIRTFIPSVCPCPDDGLYRRYHSLIVRDTFPRVSCSVSAIQITRTNEKSHPVYAEDANWNETRRDVFLELLFFLIVMFKCAKYFWHRTYIYIYICLIFRHGRLLLSAPSPATNDGRTGPEGRAREILSGPVRVTWKYLGSRRGCPS